MTTSIKIDFDDAGVCTHVRITKNGVQTLLPGGKYDLSLLDHLIPAAEAAGNVDVAATVAAALEANQITLVEAERIKRREALLDAKLNARRAEVAALEADLADKQAALAIADKQTVLDALTRDVGEIVAIVDKQAAIASLDAQIEAKTAAPVAVDGEAL